jgi:hypothetical protein
VDIRVGDVAGDRERATAQPLDLGDRAGQPLLPARDQAELGALAGELGRNRAAEPALAPVTTTSGTTRLRAGGVPALG